MRGCIPAFAMAELLEDALQDDADNTLVWKVAVVLVGVHAVLRMRASSMVWEKADVTIMANGAIRIRSRFVKNMRHAAFAQIRIIAPAPEGTPRGDLIKLVKKAIARGGRYGHPAGRQQGADAAH